MPVFINRILNLKRIKVIGFDMDYTLVGYHTKELEKLTYTLVIDTLIKDRGYPEEIRKLKFNFNRSIVGIVIDKRKGNLLKLSRYNKVKLSYHGLREIGYQEQNKLYQEMAIDIKTSDFQSLDTSFSISNGVLYSQLVQLKDSAVDLPGFYQLAEDLKAAIDTVHQNGSLKSIIKGDFKKYVDVDPEVTLLLERYLAYGKKLIIITNSDYTYSNDLLNFAINPFLKNHKKWQELFEIVITLADKPRFFTDRNGFLKVDEETGLMKNHFGHLSRGIYQGGWFKKVQRDLCVQGSEILYLGDHIYGDVVSIKKSCNWRTALVLGDLEDEISNIKASKNVQKEITDLMMKKSKLEAKINLYDISGSKDKRKKRETIAKLFEEIDAVNGRISEKLAELKKYFNPYWGEVLRSGLEESRFADQVERYACIYMTKVSDLYSYSPRTYFRPLKRLLPHEITALK
ncbi:MAG: HAD-IG family 5'-nucleotidase [Spirochaetes bacterium]|nr:HAD-IG family 5'-nucleotidase [Spirochaetota bacterium]